MIPSISHLNEALFKVAFQATELCLTGPDKLHVLISGDVFVNPYVFISISQGIAVASYDAEFKDALALGKLGKKSSDPVNGFPLAYELSDEQMEFLRAVDDKFLQTGETTWKVVVVNKLVSEACSS